MVLVANGAVRAARILLALMKLCTWLTDAEAGTPRPKKQLHVAIATEKRSIIACNHRMFVW